MKKLLFLFSLLIVGLSSWAQSGHETTTDHLSISESVTLSPGEKLTDSEIYRILSIKLEGSRLYTAFGFDLKLPEGYEFDVDSPGEWETAINASVDEYEIYPYTSSKGKKTYSHTLSANGQSDGSLRITTLSQSSAEFNSNSGVIVNVYIKATSYAKPGPVAIQIKNCFFTTSAGVQYDTQDITISDKVSASTSATASLTISATNQWSTCVLPFSTDVPEGVTAYTCSTTSDAETLYLSKSATIEAYKPYVLYSESGYSGTLSGTVDASKYPENGYVTDGYLNGAITSQSVTQGYVMQNQSEGVMFYPIGIGATFLIPAGKCWVNIPATGSAKSLKFVTDEETAINTIQSNNMSSEEIFTLQGVKVTKMTPGNIYLKSGKLILKK